MILFVLLLSLFFQNPSFAENDEFKRTLVTGTPEDKLQVLSTLQNDGSEASFDLIKSVLSDVDEIVRLKAVFIISSTENEKAIKPLFQSAIHDESVKVRILAAEGLFKLNIKSALSYIHSSMNYSNKWELIFILNRLEVLQNPSSIKVVDDFLMQGKFSDEMVSLKLQKTLNILKGKISYENIKKSQSIVDEAMTSFQNQEYEKSNILIKEAMGYDNQNPDAYWLRAKINEIKKAIPFAIKDLQDCLRYGHSNPAEIYYQIGTLIINTGDYKGSIPYFQLSVNLKKNPDTLYQLGVAYYSINSFEIAIDCFNKAVLINPEHVAANCGLAQVYQFNGKSAEASFHQKICNEGKLNQ